MTTPPTADPGIAGLQARLAELTLADERRLQRRLDGLRRMNGLDARRERLAAIEAEADAAARLMARRRAAVPEIRYPALPVSERRAEIAGAVRDHQVVIVAGETGSGKTTQLPKICLELGRGVRGMIGHTQPRRLAARTVADRIAEELGVPLGTAVGYTVRFTDQVREDTLVKLMTDGILLAEIGRDRRLERYDTLIIDEAHERSLNVDFLLGYLKALLPRRPDLKVVITSATIDPARFSRHFDDAPVIEVSGRTHPVELRYRPVLDDDTDPDRDQTQAVVEAVEELRDAGPGDVLVFLSGEREIRDTADALRRADLAGTEVLPLYARLSTAEQHRVFEPHAGRRVVLATNVAETSLTVPGIRYVVDPGTARISRYSRRTKVQRLPIEPISQASAGQRAGRCGRVAAGICIRLYTEADLLARPAYTDPEIVRTNLASVILAMAALGLGDMGAFPFLDPPDRRNIRDGVALLEELGAFDPVDGSESGRRLTPLGRRLAQLPVDPRLGRMVLEADTNGCLREVLVIVAALSISDPRERPADQQPAATALHGRFADERSDFGGYLNLWAYLRDQQQALSTNQFRRLCRTEYLHYLRVREWQDLHAQLRRVAAGMGLRIGSEVADPDRIHQSLLAGLLSHIGLREGAQRDFLGARGARFAVSPGSVLFAKPPRWLMAAELVETSRLWGRVAARIEPEWAERAGAHLVHRSHSEPRWDSSRGGVVAAEKVTLYGVPLVSARTVDYGRIDPVLSRQLFLQHALVEGDWDTSHAFFAANRRRLAEVGELEDRARRRDLVVDDAVLFDFYDRRIPADVVSTRHFDAWWKRARRSTPELLTFSRDMLLRDDAGRVRSADYPDVWVQGEVRLPLVYRFEPGSDTDGVSVTVPLAVLDRIDPTDFEWTVPGLRLELVTALIRSLPKSLRTSFVPAPDHAAAVLPLLRPREEHLLESLSRELLRRTGVPVPPDAWQPDRLPDHLRPTFRVVDGSGHLLGESKDLAELRRRLQREVRALLSEVAADVERRGLRQWTIGTLPRRLDRRVGAHTVTGFPALVDETDTVAVRVFRTEAEQRLAMWRGTRRLLLLVAPSPLRSVLGRLSNDVKLALAHNPHGGVPALLEDCMAAAVDRLLRERGGPAYDGPGFESLLDQVRARLADTTFDTVTVVARILATAHVVDEELRRAGSPVLAPSVADMRTQLSRLVDKGFVTATGWQRLPDVLRYLCGIEHRVHKAADDPGRDRQRIAVVERVQRSYADALHRLPPEPARRTAAHTVRWQIEELRISLFAQHLGTPEPVSEQRILRALDELLR